MSTAEAIDEIDRAKFLGGSDAAAVIGVSPWNTPVELWMKKTGRTPTEVIDRVRQKIFDRGHKLEPFIREMVIDKLRDRGHKVELIACNQRYIDPEFPFLSCEIDFELLIDDEHVNCDAKSVTGFARKKWGEEDSEDVPIEYAAQFMFGLMVAPGNRRRCLVAALRSFDDVDIFWTVRDDETIAAMRPKLVSFWVDHVQADIAPDPSTFTDIKALFPRDNGLATEATQDIADKVSQLREVKARIKEFEEAEEALAYEIAEFISPHARLSFEGADIATWKAQNDTRVSNKLIEAAEIYEREGDKYVRIEQPKSRFSQTKVIRVLRFPNAKKGTQ